MNGLPQRESTGETNKRKAQAYLAHRLAEVAKRRKEGAATGINRELALLRSAYWLAHESTPRKVSWVPTFHMLKENKRTGFLHDKAYDALMKQCSHVGVWMRTLVEIYATFGWRKRELLGSLRVNQVDLNHRTIMLFDSKNKDGRTIVMTEKIFDLVSMCVIGKKPEDYVFTREDGKPVKDFRQTWKKVTAAASVPGLLLHDLRRTAARNMRRVGIHEDTIMKIGGWKTRSVFSRYNIVDDHDLLDAAERLNSANSARTVQVSTETGAQGRPTEPSTEARIN